MAGGPDPGTTNTGVAHHGTVPVPGAGDAGKILTVTLDESGYSLGSSSTELGYAERTTNATTTNTAYSSTPSNKIGGLSVTVVGAGLPVYVEFFCPVASHSVAGTGVNAVLLVNGAVTGGQLIASNGINSLTCRRRILLTAGTSYTFEVGMYVAAAGTGTYSAAADFPMHLAVTR